MVWLCEIAAPFVAPVGAAPQCPDGTDGTITDTFTAADVIGPGGEQISSGDFNILLDIIDAGAAYVLVHSNEFIPGEIRGQFGGNDLAHGPRRDIPLIVSRFAPGSVSHRLLRCVAA